MRYSKLLNKKINLEFNGNAVNSYKLTEIKKTDRFVIGIGRMYSCLVDWDNKNISGALPTMDFDEQTLNALMKKGQAVCPQMNNLIFKVV